jgi:tetratricopeptide (TPR) repeat protein
VGDAKGGYLLGFQSLSGTIGPSVRVPVDEQKRQWEQILEKAESHAASGHYHRAVNMYRSLFSNKHLTQRMGDRGGYVVRLSLGKVLLKMQVIEHAATMFKEATSLQTDCHEAHYFIALARSKQGRLDEAITHYKLVLFFEPHHMGALHKLGSLLLARNNINEGLHYYRAASDIRNQNASTLTSAQSTTRVADNQLYHHFIEHVLECFSLNDQVDYSSELYARVQDFLELQPSEQFSARTHFDFGTSLQALGLMEAGLSHMHTAAALCEKYELSWGPSVDIAVALQVSLVSESRAKEVSCVCVSLHNVVDDEFDQSDESRAVLSSMLKLREDILER